MRAERKPWTSSLRAPLAFAVLALTMVACSEGDCEVFDIQPVEGALAAGDCENTIRFEGLDYRSWCYPVRPELVGPVIGRGEPSERFTFRSIEGVAPEDAVAMRVQTQRGDRWVEAEPECGTWRFAPSSELRDAMRLAKRVALVGSS